VDKSFGTQDKGVPKVKAASDNPYDDALNTVLSTVGANLRWRKESLALKLWEISAATGGMEIGGLSRLFNGQREFYPGTLVRLSLALGVEFGDWFLASSEFKKRYPAGDARPFRIEAVPTGRSRSSSASTGARQNRATRDYVHAA
jgi:hypothetical protein